MDLSTTLFDGRKTRFLTIVDTFTGCHRRSRCASSFVAPMSSKRSNGLADGLATRRQTGSITYPKLGWQGHWR